MSQPPNDEIVSRSEMHSFRLEIHEKLEPLREWYIESRVRMENTERTLSSLQQTVTSSLNSISMQISGLDEKMKKSESFWFRFAQGLAAGLGAGYAIYQTITLSIHH